MARRPWQRIAPRKGRCQTYSEATDEDSARAARVVRTPAVCAIGDARDRAASHPGRRPPVPAARAR
ncbi:hypothetical protein SPHINGO361_70027 [Sphingomonas sp. EC-HK361]|nr:hypothetical protein SPHINGO361_70027 [Sphingomonas sp. EC-HK361]